MFRKKINIFLHRCVYVCFFICEHIYCRLHVNRACGLQHLQKTYTHIYVIRIRWMHFPVNRLTCAFTKKKKNKTYKFLFSLFIIVSQQHLGTIYYRSADTPSQMQSAHVCVNTFNALLKSAFFMDIHLHKEIIFAFLYCYFTMML